MKVNYLFEFQIGALWIKKKTFLWSFSWKPHFRNEICVNRNQNELFELQIGADVTNCLTVSHLVWLFLRSSCWKPYLKADISVNRNQSELFELQIGADVTHYRTKESERTPANFQQGKL